MNPTRCSLIAALTLAASAGLVLAQADTKAQPSTHPTPAPATAPTTKPAATTPAQTNPAAPGHGDPATMPAHMDKPMDGSGMAGMPGMTPEDMKMMEACMQAATPGPMHEHLARGAGNWEGKSRMWMKPGGPAIEMPCTSVVSMMMDGRYSKVEVDGQMPGMGPFKGMGIYGFDNVSQKFQSTWIDSFGTGMMTGTGVLSADGKILTWTMKMNDPMTKKETTIREVDTFPSDNEMKLEMFGPDPAGKNYKMMEINYTRNSGSAAAGHGAAQMNPSAETKGKVMAGPESRGASKPVKK